MKVVSITEIHQLHLGMGEPIIKAMKTTSLIPFIT